MKFSLSLLALFLVDWLGLRRLELAWLLVLELMHGLNDSFASFLVAKYCVPHCMHGVPTRTRHFDNHVARLR